MSKKYRKIILIFSFICVILPFFVEWLYILGETYPIISTIYTQSDVLGYISASIGLIVSLIALCLSLSATEVNMELSHASTVNEFFKDEVVIEIKNLNNFDCDVNSIEICNVKKHRYAHIVSTPPFTVPAMGIEAFAVEVERIQEILTRIQGDSPQRHIKYCIRTSLGNSIYLSSKELYSTINNISEHEKHIYIGKKRR